MAGAGMPETELFTRGGMDTGNRGESMVQKHAEKQQQEKEAKAMEKVGALMPQIGRLVHALALEECSWDVERAILLLRQFHADNADKLAALLKKHKKLLKEATQQQANAAGHKEGGAEEASSSESGERGSSSEDEEAGGRDSEQERSKAHKSSKSKKSKSKKGSKESKEKEKERRSKKRRREKESRRKERGSPEAKAAKLTHGDSFGKYGILRETDYYAKRSDFMRWALDEKRIDVDLMPKNEEKDLFREYMEDYNTGTLPHKKYYDLEAYERYKAAKAAKKGRQAADADAAKKRGMGFNDEQELMRERQEARARAQQERLQEAFIELKSGSKAQDMREQELLRMQANLAYKTGDMVTAHKLMERLKPDDPREEEGRKP